jgi:hypothetical protein
MRDKQPDGRHFYVYIYKDSAGHITYIGKGQHTRATEHFYIPLKSLHNSNAPRGQAPFSKWLRQQLINHEPVTLQIVSHYLTEQEALALENALLRQHRSQALLNVQYDPPGLQATTLGAPAG